MVKSVVVVRWPRLTDQIKRSTTYRWVIGRFERLRREGVIFLITIGIALGMVAVWMWTKY